MWTEENFSHEVNAAISTELHYTHQDSWVTVHRAGCKHAAERRLSFDLGEVQADDFYNVAPCARKRR